MNVTEAFFARRSVRAYAPRVVDEATIHSLLRAAVQAPSAENAQPWAFAIVQDTAQLKRYSDQAKKMLLDDAASEAKVHRYEELLRNESFNIFYDAGTLIVICATERGPYSDANCWLAAQNLMLAACDVGLGSCCVGFAIPVLNTRAAKDDLHLPMSGAAVAPIIVGFASVLPPPVVRREPEVLTWTR